MLESEKMIESVEAHHKKFMESYLDDVEAIRKSIPIRDKQIEDIRWGGVYFVKAEITFKLAIVKMKMTAQPRDDIYQAIISVMNRIERSTAPELEALNNKLTVLITDIEGRFQAHYALGVKKQRYSIFTFADSMSSEITRSLNIIASGNY